MKLLYVVCNLGTFLVGAHGSKNKKGKRKFGGVISSLPPERSFTCFFDGLQYYERLPTHPPKHGLPANCAIDSWLWLSRVSVLGGPVPCTLVRSCSYKTCGLLDGLAAHQNVRSYDVSFLLEIISFCINMKIKRSLYIGQSEYH